MSRTTDRRAFKRTQPTVTAIGQLWAEYETASAHAERLDDEADTIDGVVGQAHPYPPELASLFGEDWIDHSAIRERFGFGSPETVRLGAILNAWLEARAKAYHAAGSEDAWARAGKAHGHAQDLLERVIGTPAQSPADVVAKVRAVSIFLGKGDPASPHVATHWDHPLTDPRDRDRGKALLALLLDAQMVAADPPLCTPISAELARLVESATSAKKAHAAAVTAADHPPSQGASPDEEAAVADAATAMDGAFQALFDYTPRNPKELAHKAHAVASVWSLLTDEQADAYPAVVARDARASAIGRTA